MLAVLLSNPLRIGTLERIHSGEEIFRSDVGATGALNLLEPRHGLRVARHHVQDLLQDCDR